MRHFSRHRLSQMIGTNPSEADLVICMVRDINTLIPGAYCWRMETRGIPKRTKTGWKVERNDMERGKPDISGSVTPMDSYGDFEGHKGLSFVIEAKMPGEYLKPHQREWLFDYLLRGGGRAAVCHSSAEAMEFVKAVQTGANAVGAEILRTV